MSEYGRCVILSIVSLVFCALFLYTVISRGGCLVGAIGSGLITMFWYHLWRLEEEKTK